MEDMAEHPPVQRHLAQVLENRQKLVGYEEI
jgi:hypothetical protein